MKNLADLKRAIKPGVKIECLEHWQPNMVGRVMTVAKVQTNAFTTRSEGDDGRQGWHRYEKANCYSFPAADTFRVDAPRGGATGQDGLKAFWVYRILPQDIANSANEIHSQTAECVNFQLA